MIRGISITVLALLSGFGLVNASSNAAMDGPAVQQPSKKGSKAPASPKEPQSASLTGCIDEQDGLWVILNDQTRSILAKLLADGFPTEGFAKYLGHKVTVRGTSSSDGPGTQFKVRQIQTISETCSAR